MLKQLQDAELLRYQHWRKSGCSGFNPQKLAPISLFVLPPALYPSIISSLFQSLTLINSLQRKLSFKLAAHNGSAQWKNQDNLSMCGGRGEPHYWEIHSTNGFSLLLKLYNNTWLIGSSSQSVEGEWESNCSSQLLSHNITSSADVILNSFYCKEFRLCCLITVPKWAGKQQSPFTHIHADPIIIWL